MQGLRAAEDGGERLNRDPHDVVVRLLRGQRAPRGLRMEAQLHRTRIGRAETIAADEGPQPPGGPELGDLFEEVVVRVEEEGESLAEAVDVQARLSRRFDVGDRVRKRER